MEHEMWCAAVQHRGECCNCRVMKQPSKEEVERWLGITQSGLIGCEYRDVFLKLPQILRSYLALREEVERKNRLIKMQDEFITDKSKVAAIRGTRIEQLDMAIASLQADNEGLRALANEIVVYAGLYEDTYLDTHFLPILQKAKELV